MDFVRKISHVLPVRRRRTTTATTQVVVQGESKLLHYYNIVITIRVSAEELLFYRDLPT